FFSFYCYAHHPHLHSFPTRRSSDLPPRWACRPAADRRSALMDFDLTDDQRELAALTREILADRLTAERLRETDAKGSRFDRALRSEEHTSELQSRFDLVCRLLLEKK